MEPHALKSAFPTPRDAVSHIMEPFPIVKKKDLESFSLFRTKETYVMINDTLKPTFGALPLTDPDYHPAYHEPIQRNAFKR